MFQGQFAAAELRHPSIMTEPNEGCNDRRRSQTQRERGPDLYPVPKSGPTLVRYHFDDCLAQLRPTFLVWCEPLSNSAQHERLF
jgi:hypothetical protein